MKELTSYRNLKINYFKINNYINNNKNSNKAYNMSYQELIGHDLNNHERLNTDSIYHNSNLMNTLDNNSNNYLKKYKRNINLNNKKINKNIIQNTRIKEENRNKNIIPIEKKDLLIKKNTNKSEILNSKNAHNINYNFNTHKNLGNKIIKINNNYIKLNKQLEVPIDNIKKLFRNKINPRNYQVDIVKDKSEVLFFEKEKSISKFNQNEKLISTPTLKKNDNFRKNKSLFQINNGLTKINKFV